MTPRELVLFAAGALLGAISQACRKPCCAVKPTADLGEPPRKPHNMMSGEIVEYPDAPKRSKGWRDCAEKPWRPGPC